MENVNYTAENNSEQQPAPDVRNKASFLSSINKKWIFYGVVGILFILIYTGGSYYVLFSMNKKKDTTPAYIAPPAITATPFPTPTAVPTVMPAAGSTVQWITYINKKYGFSVTFPQELNITFNKTPEGVDPYVVSLYYPNSSPSGVLTINVQDIAYVGQSEVETRSIMNMSLLNFASKKRELNFAFDDPEVPRRGVSALFTTLFLGNPAYSFTVSGSYSDDRNYLPLPEEYTYLFTQTDDYKVVISYPTGDAYLKKVFETIRFE